MQEIVPKIFAVPGMSIGRIYIIVGSSGLTLVDTGLSTQTADKLEKQLQADGYQLSDIQNILITHAHPDHLGGLAGIQRRTNARTHIHRRDAPVARGEQPVVRPAGQRGVARWMTSVLPAPAPGRIDVELKEGDRLDEILSGLTVIELHGHSPGQSGFWWPEKRLLLGGDVLMHMPWGLTLPFKVATPDMDDAKRSIRKTVDLAPDILCFGHGTPLIGNAAERISAFARQQKL